MGFIRSTITRINNFQVRTLASKTTNKLAPYIREGESVLDIGCGLGAQAIDIEKKTNAKITGIDVIDYSKGGFPVRVFDGTHIPYPDNAFDVSYFSYVLHHAEKPIKLLAEAMRVTKNKILILEDTPKNSFDRLLDAYHGWSFNKFYGLEAKTVFRTQEEWERIFDEFRIPLRHSFPLKRFDREPYFPISRTLFVLEL